MEILRGRMGDSHATQAVTCPRSPHICYAITPTGDFTTAEGQHHHSGARVFFDFFARKRRTLNRNPQRGGVPCSFRLFPHSTLQKKRILGLPYGASLNYGRRKPLGNAERSRGSLATVDPLGTHHPCANVRPAGLSLFQREPETRQCVTLHLESGATCRVSDREVPAGRLKVARCMYIAKVFLTLRIEMAYINR